MIWMNVCKQWWIAMMTLRLGNQEGVGQQSNHVRADEAGRKSNECRHWGDNCCEES
jgi:hypothetical protein